MFFSDFLFFLIEANDMFFVYKTQILFNKTVFHLVLVSCFYFVFNSFFHFIFIFISSGSVLLNLHCSYWSPFFYTFYYCVKSVLHSIEFYLIRSHCIVFDVILIVFSILFNFYVLHFPVLYWSFWFLLFHYFKCLFYDISMYWIWFAFSKPFFLYLIVFHWLLKKRILMLL